MSSIQTNRHFLGTVNGSHAEMKDAQKSVRNSYAKKYEKLTEKNSAGMDVVLGKVANIRHEFMQTWSLQRCDRGTHAGLAKLAGLVIGNILTAGLMSGIATLICRVKEARAFSGAQNALNMLGQAALTYEIAKQTNNTIAKNRKQGTQSEDSDVVKLIPAIRILCANDEGFLDGEKVAQFMAIVDFEDASQNARNIEDFGAQVEEMEESYDSSSSSIFNQSAMNELKEAVFYETFEEVVAARLAQGSSTLPEQEAVREAIETYYTEITGRAVASQEPEGEPDDFDDKAADFRSALREQLSSAQRTPSHQAGPMQPLVNSIVIAPKKRYEEAQSALDALINQRTESLKQNKHKLAQENAKRCSEFDAAKENLSIAIQRRAAIIGTIPNGALSTLFKNRTFSAAQRETEQALRRFRAAAAAVAERESSESDKTITTEIENAITEVNNARKALDESLASFENNPSNSSNSPAQQEVTEDTVKSHIEERAKEQRAFLEYSRAEITSYDTAIKETPLMQKFSDIVNGPMQRNSHVTALPVALNRFTDSVNTAYSEAFRGIPRELQDVINEASTRAATGLPKKERNNSAPDELPEPMDQRPPQGQNGALGAASGPPPSF